MWKILTECYDNLKIFEMYVENPDKMLYPFRDY